MINQETKLTSDIKYIKGIGPKRAEVFIKNGISTKTDLLKYYPRAYIDRNSGTSIRSVRDSIMESNLFEQEEKVSKISEFNIRSEYSIIGGITSKDKRKVRGGKELLRLVIEDGSQAKATVVFWNMVQYFSKIYEIGQLISVSGQAELSRNNQVQFTHPDIDIIDPEDVELYKRGAILPNYRLSEDMRRIGISNKIMRRIIANIINDHLIEIKESLSAVLIKKYKLPPLQIAVKNLHFPDDKKMLEKSVLRMKFEELFYYQLALIKARTKFKTTEKGLILDQKSKLARKLYDTLPFELTTDQKIALKEIDTDFRSGSPMNRLLQGDVGSGKTIVAALAMLMAIDNRCQVAIMAPTEILAEQHYHTFLKFFASFELKVVQLVGGLKTKDKQDLKEEIESGKANVIVGTHAMFQSDIKYRNLGMVVIDEQHRFGVEQRSEFIKLARESNNDKLIPHVLLMTATPIPRTLTMTYYGELNVSTIREKPKGRKDILTKIVFDDQIDRVYDFVRQKVKKGQQAYIIYPLVEKSEKLEDLKSAVEYHKKLSNEVFPDLKVGLIHGQQLWYEKEDTMKDFRDKKYDLLVATTVVEVGIDVPNATVMVIENAERFGLSQLHQLRGRVGRSNLQSYCLLIAQSKLKYIMNRKEEQFASVFRLKTMAETNDGFKISEADLKLRGPGDLLGKKQSGIPEFIFADITKDQDLIGIARNEAKQLINIDPELTMPENDIIKKNFEEKAYGEKGFFNIA